MAAAKTSSTAGAEKKTPAKKTSAKKAEQTTVEEPELKTLEDVPQEEEVVKPAKRSTKKKADAEAEVEPAVEESDVTETEEGSFTEDEVDVPEDEDPALKALADLMATLKKTKRAHTDASYTDRREMYGAYKQAADTAYINEENRVATRATLIREEYEELVKASNPRLKIIKKVLLIGVEEDATYGLVMVGELVSARKHAEFKIKIPTSELAMFAAESFKNLVAFQAQLEKWIGSVVQVVILNVDEKNRTAMASRLAASTRLATKYFRGEKPIIPVGEVATGTIIYATIDYIKVDVHGQDIRIKSSETSWEYQLALKHEFKKGQNVMVKITSKEEISYEVNERTYKMIVLEGSIREATDNPKEIYFDDFEIGSCYLADYKGASSEGNVFVSLAGKVTCLCKPPLVGKLGDRCLVRITSKNDAKKLIFGEIVRENV